MKIRLLFVFCLCLNIFPGLAEAGNGRISWETKGAAKKAVAEKKLLFIYFYADWCPVCRKMDKVTYADKRIISYLNRYVPVRINIERNKDVARKFGVKPRRDGGKGIPVIMITDPRNKRVLEERIGYITPEKLLNILKR